MAVNPYMKREVKIEKKANAKNEKSVKPVAKNPRMKKSKMKPSGKMGKDCAY